MDELPEIFFCEIFIGVEIRGFFKLMGTKLIFKLSC